MKQKNFISLASLIFLAIAFLHLGRIIYDWEAIIGGWEVPRALSWAALIVAGYLSFSGFQLAKKA